MHHRGTYRMIVDQRMIPPSSNDYEWVIKYCARSGHLEEMREIIEQAPQIETRTLEEALVGAANSGQLPCLEYLLQRVPRIEVRQKALDVAAHHGNLSCVQRLVESISFAQGRNADEALLSAAKNNRHEVVRYLHQQNVSRGGIFRLFYDPILSRQGIEHAFLQSVEKKVKETIEYFLNNADLSLEMKNQALTNAVASNDVDLVTTLVRGGADPFSSTKALFLLVKSGYYSYPPDEEWIASFQEEQRYDICHAYIKNMASRNVPLDESFLARYTPLLSDEDLVPIVQELSDRGMCSDLCARILDRHSRAVSLEIIQGRVQVRGRMEGASTETTPQTMMTREQQIELKRRILRASQNPIPASSDIDRTMRQRIAGHREKIEQLIRTRPNYHDQSLAGVRYYGTDGTVVLFDDLPGLIFKIGYVGQDRYG